MNILIFSWRDIKNPSYGGAEIVTHELAKRWVMLGNKVTVFGAEFPSCKRSESVDGVRYIRRGSIFTERFFAIYYYFKNLSSKTDIVIDQFHVFPFFTPFFVKKKKVGLIFETTGDIWWYQIPFPFNLFGFLIEPIVFLFYRAIPFITISDSTKKDLVKMGIKPGNISVFKVGITNKPLSNLPTKEKLPTLITVGRITPMKRIEDTIKAFKFVQKKFPKSKLWIIGDGNPDYISKLNNISYKLHVSEDVTFWGKVSERLKNELLSKAWCLVSTSVKEGWGLVVIEANACGTTTVTYKSGALKEAVKNRESGILVGETPESLSKGVIEIFSNSRLRKRLSKNALLYSKGFSWGKSSKSVLSFLKEI